MGKVMSHFLHRILFRIWNVDVEKMNGTLWSPTVYFCFRRMELWISALKYPPVSDTPEFSKPCSHSSGTFSPHHLVLATKWSSSADARSRILLSLLLSLCSQWLKWKNLFICGSIAINFCPFLFTKALLHDTKGEASKKMVDGIMRPKATT